ncbi:MAG: radical SAM protein, partial [Ignavibacteriae bacterium]|nr:radical SAM protein [Ignavibacteriota bacterium]
MKSNNKIRILLAANPDSYFGVDMFFRITNLGLCSLAANVDRNLYDVKVIDLIAVRRKYKKYFLNLLILYKPDIVGFSCMAFQYASTLELAKLTKEYNKNITVILGGYYPTVDSQSILESYDMRFIDYIIRGEGEISFNEFLKAYSIGKNYENVPGLSYISNHTVINIPFGCLVNLDELKLPDRSVRLIDKGFNCMGFKSDAIETSRGCVYECNFCSIQNMYGKSFRKYKIERVLDDIRDAKKYGAKSIMMTDDNISLDGKRFKELCEAITSEGLNDIKYLTQASVSGIKKTPGLAKAMGDSGMNWVFLGIESAHDSALDYMNKSSQLKSSDAEDVVKELKEYGIIVIGGFIFGYPDDTEETLRANFEYAKRIGVDIPTFNILTPYPNTKVRGELLQQDLITNKFDYSKYDCWEVNIKTKYLSTEQIYKVRNELEARFPIESGALWRMAKKYPAY